MWPGRQDESHLSPDLCCKAENEIKDYALFIGRCLKMIPGWFLSGCFVLVGCRVAFVPLMLINRKHTVLQVALLAH